MPIEIRELTIKVNVNQDQNKIASDSASANGSAANEEKEALIKEAAEEVFRILDYKKER